MNYPFPTPSPYMQSAMSHAVQALMLGTALPQNCVIMAMPFQQAQQIIPQLLMHSSIGGSDQMILPQQTSYYGPSPYMNNPQLLALPPSYNYPIVPYNNNGHNNNKSKKRTHHQQQPQPNLYNSSSFDSYMNNLSWSRLFDHTSRRTSKQTNQKQPPINFDRKTNTSKKQGSDSSTSSSSSSSSSSSDETIRRIDVVHNKQSSNNNSKPPTKSSLPFKYSSEFIPHKGKQQQSQKIKSNDIFIVKKA